MKTILQDYKSFYERTLNGDHGHTAKFALMYVDMVDLFFHLERAIRTSDVDLYNHATHEMCALFFAFNHQNYARWLTRNRDNFVNINSTHPGLLEDFKNGALSVRRTKKHFCRSPVDLTLEQTINADAANKLTGITAFTNNLDARQRWSETHSARITILSEFLESIDLTKFSEQSESAYQSKMFTKQVNLFVEQLEKNINPFGDYINASKLFNLSTGKAASSETVDFLLNIQSNGQQQRDAFIKDCGIDSAHFDRPIKRNVVRNFAAENGRNKQSTVKQTDAAKIERNILGHMLCYSTDKKIDLLSVLSYPLTTVPHSLANPDGSMITNGKKDELTALLLSKIDKIEESLPMFEVEVLDGFYFLSTLRDSPTKYGHFASFLLKRICDTAAHEIHIIFDKDDGPSIKDLNIRKKVNEDCASYEIKGPNQERRGNLSKCMNNVNFRKELVDFLIKYWADDAISSQILGEKRVFLSNGARCYLYSNNFEKNKPISIFESNHIVVETRMILHLSKIAAEKILIKISTTDTLLVCLLYHMQFWKQGKEIWIQTGETHKNTTQMIKVNQIFDQLSRHITNALPAWYVFCGCRFEPSFYGKGKKSCLKHLENNSEFQTAFVGLGANESETVVAALEEFTCRLYNTKEKSVNKARLKIFESSFGTTTGKLKNFGLHGEINKYF